ncbi:hypothetical protein C0989_010282 [Termitomyces sp. Mn162]|nr:hypothetical protein C0989_010282 [Termitomyces sp. Mn162]
MGLGAPMEQSMEGSWSAAKAFLCHQIEGLECLLVASEEEVCRVGEDQDAMQREQDVVWQDGDMAQWDKDVAMRMAIEQLSQLQELEAQTRQLQAWEEVAEMEARVGQRALHAEVP